MIKLEKAIHQPLAPFAVGPHSLVAIVIHFPRIDLTQPQSLSWATQDMNGVLICQYWGARTLGSVNMSERIREPVTIPTIQVDCICLGNDLSTQSQQKHPYSYWVTCIRALVCDATAALQRCIIAWLAEMMSDAQTPRHAIYLCQKWLNTSSYWLRTVRNR